MDQVMNNCALITIIIPVYNEAGSLPKLLAHIQTYIGEGVAYEIIICDGGSTDRNKLTSYDSNVRVLACSKGRAVQMNAGARSAVGNILYFLHADTFPPYGFGKQILAYNKDGYVGGCYRLKFDLSHWVLKFSGWASRFNIPLFQFGDQSLYVDKLVFEEINGYKEDLLLMEDLEIVSRIRSKGKFTVMPFTVITSARKYKKFGVIKTEFTHLVVYIMFLLKFRQILIAKVYSAFLK